MEYPLYIKGERRGTLRLTQEGLFTVFELWCERAEDLLRVSVYGEGREGYLGLMEPKGQGAYLRRALSRSAMRGFPAGIEYAAEAGLGSQAETSSKEKEAPTEKKNDEALPDACSGDDELIWYARTDGTLCTFDGESSIIAIPSEMRQGASGAVLRQIGGREYILFRY